LAVLSRLARLPRSFLTAAAIAAALLLWMASGWLFPSAPEEDAAAADGGDRAVSVQVREQRAEMVTRFLTAQGHSEPDRSVQVRAETGGRVARVLVAKGERVQAGQPLARLDEGDRPARLREARARVRQAETEYEAARNLGKSGYSARAKVEAAEASLESARARLAAIEKELADTTIRAPFAGVLEARAAEEGDFLQPGAEVATVVDLRPLVVAVRVAQQRIGEVAEGAAAEVRFANGRTGRGEVRFVAATADSDTRTFRVEIAVPNPDAAVPAGLSAEVRMPVGKTRAHFVSPALLSLDEQGRLGIKTVGDDERVAFHAVQRVRSEPDGLWVTGLPKRARVITIGQGFVRAGDRVRVVSEGGSKVSGSAVQRTGAE
jgi:multidrug efflux system membrane fusion protein